MNIFKTCTACMGGFWLWVWSRNVCLECSEERQSRSWKDKFVWVTVEALRNSGLALRDKEDWVHLTLILPSLPPSLYPQFYSALNIWRHSSVCPSVYQQTWCEKEPNYKVYILLPSPAHQTKVSSHFIELNVISITAKILKKATNYSDNTRSHLSPLKTGELSTSTFIGNGDDLSLR